MIPTPNALHHIKEPFVGQKIKRNSKVQIFLKLSDVDEIIKRDYRFTSDASERSEMVRKVIHSGWAMRKSDEQIYAKVEKLLDLRNVVYKRKPVAAAILNTLTGNKR